VAQLVITDTDLPVSAAALVSPAIRLTSIVAGYERWRRHHRPQFVYVAAQQGTLAAENALPGADSSGGPGGAAAGHVYHPADRPPLGSPEPRPANARR
jgi:hypothetical protein